MKLMRWLLLGLLALPLPAQSAGMLLLGAGGGGACVPGTHASTFLARTSGLSGTETTAYCNLINGLDTDSTYALFDALYIFATNTTTTANLNLVSTSFTITANNSPGFAADVGYTGNFTTAFLDTGLITGTNFTQNSASLGMAVQTNDTSSNAYLEMGTSGGNNSVLGSNFSLSSLYSIHESGFNGPASTTSKGMWAVSRTGASAEALYSNGSATAVNTVTTASSGVNTASIYILGRNSGSNTINNPTARQLSAAWIGGALTGAQYLLIANRINAYLTTFAIPVY